MTEKEPIVKGFVISILVTTIIIFSTAYLMRGTSKVSKLERENRNLELGGGQSLCKLLNHKTGILESKGLYYLELTCWEGNYTNMTQYRVDILTGEIKK